MRIIAAAALALAAVMQAAPPCALTETAAGGEYHDVSGLWETTAGASVLSFERRAGDREAYDVSIVEAADYSLAPGTFVGTLTATATPGTYDAGFLTDPAGKKRGTLNLIVEFDPELRSCTFRPYRKGRRVSLRRLLPYLFRLAVINDNNRPEGIDGAIRLDAVPTPVIL